MTPQTPDKSQPYLTRYLDRELDDLEGVAAIAINGAKGVGKTSTAVRRADIMYSLDRSTDFELMSAAMDTKLRENPVICLDEWQRLPELWNAVRHNVDEGVSNRYLFTGSASPIPGTDTHSGAGRILALTMRPLCLAEYEETTPTVLIDDLFAGKPPSKERATGQSRTSRKRSAPRGCPASRICQPANAARRFPAISTTQSRMMSWIKVCVSNGRTCSARGGRHAQPRQQRQRTTQKSSMLRRQGNRTNWPRERRSTTAPF
ncbi:AAA family ATPase [Corynebacterium sp. CMW7794]|uniref:AAA family ATPase n=1 Tax=Corynebacterium sp. CMW7794 TaxID=1603887 RepID=UPI000AC0E4FD|nr:AAA family ATPase [Corynebacterium sp. CMW7794]